MPITAKELNEKRAKLVNDARAMLTEFGGETGILPGDKQEQWATMLADADKLKTAADSILRQETSEAELSQTREENERLLSGKEGSLIDPLGGRKPASARSYAVRQGTEVKMVNGRSVVVPRYADIRELSSATSGKDWEPSTRATEQYRRDFMAYMQGNGATIPQDRMMALQSDNASQAGYLVPGEQFVAGILKNVDDLLFVRQYATVHTQVTASSLGIRTRTTRLSTWARGAEIQAPTADTALAYGKKSLKPEYMAGSLLVSNDLLRRGLGVEGEIQMELARDAGEVMEAEYFTGNGGALAGLGVFTASNDGIDTGRDVSTGNTSSAITATGLYSAYYSLKSQYRTGPRSGSLRWLFHRDGISQIMQLKNGMGEYLFNARNAGRPDDTILGVPVDESERSPNTFTTGLYVGILANWEFYHIADSLDMEIQRLNELNARTNQVEFLGRLKTDSMPVLAEAFARVKLG